MERPPSRRDRVCEYVTRHGFVGVEELAAWMQVSAITARRELSRLEGEGLIRRVHGGAVPFVAPFAAPHIAERRLEHAEAKRELARFAADQVRRGDRIFIDAGSTCAALAAALPEDRDLTVITHSLDVIGCVVRKIGVHLISLGGEFDPQLNAFVGTLAEGQAATFRADKAFLGVTGIDGKTGFTITTTAESALKRLMAGQAQARYVLADAAKLGRLGFHAIFPPGWDATVITDRSCTAGQLAFFRKHGIRIRIAKDGRQGGGARMSPGMHRAKGDSPDGR